MKLKMVKFLLLLKEEKMKTFKEYKLKKYLLDALDTIHFVTPTKVQSEVIPLALNNESLMVESATGSGKTHSFMIPILQKIDENKK